MCAPRSLSLALVFALAALGAACSAGEVSTVSVSGGDRARPIVDNSPIGVLDAIEAAGAEAGVGVNDPPPRVLAFAGAEATPVPVESMEDGFDSYVDEADDEAGVSDEHYSSRPVGSRTDD